MARIPRGELLDGGFHHHLLLDEARRGAFAQAIRRAVRPGDVVADVGSGTGILAWHAAQAGASRVYAVEANTHSHRTLLRAVRENGLIERVVPVLADGTRWRPPQAVDVLVCELMETGLLHEPIAAVMRNAATWDPPPRRIVPAEVFLEAEGVEVRASFDGYRVALAGFRATREDEARTTRATYARFDFRTAAPGERVEGRFEVEALVDGVVDGIQLWTRTRLVDDIVIGSSPGYCTPLVVPLGERRSVAKGERLRGRVAYDFDFAATPLEVELAP